MQIFQSTNNQNNFKLNGLTYPKNFIIIKQGDTNIAVHNAYDTNHQLLGSTHFSQIQVNGITYSSQSALMAALSTLLFAKQFNYIVQDINATKLVSVGDISVDSNDVTIEYAEWLINGVTFSTLTETVLSVPFASSGNTRIDIIIGNAEYQIQRISGVETTGIALAPIIPIDSVYITQMVVSDNAIGTPSTPITGLLYVEKKEFTEIPIYDTGNIAPNLINESSAFRIYSTGTTSVKGFTTSTEFLNTYLYVGKEIKIANSSNLEVILSHNHPSVDLVMKFPDESDLTLQPNEVAIFKFTKTSEIYAEFISVNRTTVSTGSTPSGSVEISFGATFDGGGSDIDVDSYVDVIIPKDIIITNYTLLADVSGDINISVTKDVYSNYPPTSGDTITGGNNPFITSDIKNQDSTLTGWTTSINEGDIIRFTVNSCTDITKATLSLKGYAS